MANLNVALRQLREERRQAQTQVERLDQAIAAIEGMGRTNSRRGAPAGHSRLSAAARRRIAAAQRARWARHRRLSPAARRRIAAAQRLRWMRFRQQKQKAAA